MEIKDIKPNQGKIDIVADVVAKDQPRSFEKFGKAGRVCNIKLRDNSGDVKFTLWNDEVDSVKIGDKVQLQNGWCAEYKGEKQLSAGKFGKLVVVGSAASQVMSNDPTMIQRQRQAQNDDDDEEGSDDDEPEVIEEEEFVE
ncbi:hypothetical protein HYV86_07460 [Candidatus Woesearchaeota archaeon]|nr:hypothetical protein [Candidatus Woesearchaeota archaeon]